MKSKYVTVLKLPVKLLFGMFATLLLFAINPASAADSAQQRRTISGVVLDQSGEAAIGVTVIENGTNNGEVTDMDGKFTIHLTTANPVLQFSYLGFKTVEVPVGTKTSLMVTLEDDSQMIEDVVVVGYGAQKKESVVGSISQVTSDDIATRGTVSNMTDALSGAIAGVSVLTSTGVPGGGGDQFNASEILIRGKATWNNASPLVLVDGVERDMNDVDVSEVESISVLKDASATAVFGVKGANGVILITTKSGDEGKAKVSIQANIAVKSLSEITSPEDSYTALLARNYSIVNQMNVGGDLYMADFYTPNRILNYYKDQTDPEKYPDVNWQDLMTRNFAISHRYNMNVSGGTEKVKYFTSFSYLYDGDIMATDSYAQEHTPEFDYNRFNFRTNLDFALTKTTNFKVGLSGYLSAQQSNSNFYDIWYGLYHHSPASTVPVYSDGTFGSDHPSDERYGANNYYDMINAGSKKVNRTGLTTDFTLDQKLDFITKGLSAKARFSFDNYFVSAGNAITSPGDVTKRWNEATQEWNYIYPNSFDQSTGLSYVKGDYGFTREYGNGSQTQKNIYYEAGLNYNRQVGDHNIGAMALFTRQENSRGGNWPSKREDWVGRITYDYKGRYLFESNGAYNGSEKFGDGYKFAFFPSVALGWRLSEEGFFKNNISAVNNVKFRYSAGMIGNDNLAGISKWPYLTMYELATYGNTKINGNDYYRGSYAPSFGSGSSISRIPYTIYTEGDVANPDLGWETSFKQNFGVEVGVLENMFTATFDYYKEDRSDILLAAAQRNVPPFLGQAAPAANVGQVKSWGCELELKFQNTHENGLYYWASYTWTQSKNKIIAKEDPLYALSYQKSEGHSIGQTSSTVSTGIMKNWDEVFTGALSEKYNERYLSMPGEYRTIDYNADGIINSNDNVPVNHTIYPANTYSMSGGLEYKGFSFMVQFYGVYNTTQDLTYSYYPFPKNAAVVYPFQIEDTFTPEYGNTDATYKSFGLESTGSASYYKVDGSYLRLKTMEIGYNLPKTVCQSLLTESIRVYLNGNNLFYWGDMPVDIEGVNFSTTNYPTMKQFNIGLNVTF